MSPLYYAVGASGFILRCKITQKKRYAQVFYTKNAKKGLATCDFHANIAHPEQAQMVKMTYKSC